MNCDKETEELDIEAVRAFVGCLPRENRDLLLSFFAGTLQVSKLEDDARQKLFKTLDAFNEVFHPEREKTAKEPSDNDRIALYEKFGLKVGIPLGRCWFSKSMMVAEHDGIPYCVNERDQYFKDQDEQSIAHNILHRKLIIERHHEKIKFVYDFMTSKDIGDVWVLTGGGTQLQAFFGGKQGYIAILYLDMENLEENTDPEYLKAIGNSLFYLHVLSDAHIAQFENFVHPDITLHNDS